MRFLVYIFIMIFCTSCYKRQCDAYSEEKKIDNFEDTVDFR